MKETRELMVGAAGSSETVGQSQEGSSPVLGLAGLEGPEACELETGWWMGLVFASS